jgi:hypothetical protein
MIVIAIIAITPISITQFFMMLILLLITTFYF